MRRATRRRGFGVVEVLLATVLVLMVVVMLWQGLGAVVRGAGRAERIVEAERAAEVLRHVLREELRRANHLITMDPAGVRLHDPRFSAVWILEGGAALGARVFEPDQRVEDPYAVDPEDLRQDRVYFMVRGRELVFRRTGDLTPDDLRVLVERLRSLRFRQGGDEEVGALEGQLRVEAVLGDEGEGPPDLELDFTVPLAVPVLREEDGARAPDVVPPPSLGEE